MPSHTALIEYAPAKINLYLEIMGKRPDGYHDLDSLVVFVDVGERLRFTRSDNLSLKITGPWSHALSVGEDNLILRAARLLSRRAGVKAGAEIELDKHIPVAAGIGGGSADAAAALRGLNKLWALGFSDDELCSIGVELGADVPVCVGSTTSRMLGIGDVCEEVDTLPNGLFMVLVNPRVSVPTPAVFSQLGPVKSGKKARVLPDFENTKAFFDWLAHCRNDLMPPAIQLQPVIAECLKQLRQNVDNSTSYIGMSGSGATCCALVENEAQAIEIVDRISLLNPGWWVNHGSLIVKDFVNGVN